MSIKELKKKYIGDRSFYARYLMLAVPMIIQQFISNFVQLLDNVMVGRIGTEQMSGVAIVNQLIFVYMLALFGIMGAGGIYGAQYFGNGNHKGHMYTFRFNLISGIMAGLIGISVFLFKGDFLIGLFLTDTGNVESIIKTADFAHSYMMIVMASFLPLAVANAYSQTIKETGESRIPMISGLVAMLCNAVGDYLLIFGVGPFPEMGVEGAAMATVLSRFVECFVLLIWAHGKGRSRCRFLENAYRGITIPKTVLFPIIKKGTPLMLNEFLWAMGVSAVVQCYSIRGLEVVAGLNIANTICNLFNIVFIQLGGCIGIMVGQCLGAGRLEEAKDTDNKMIFFSVACCIVMAGLALLIGPLFPNIYNTSDQVKHLAKCFISISAVIMPVCSFSHCSYFTLRSGGKTVVTFLFDSVYSWFVVIPVAACLAHFTGLTIITMYIIVQSLEIIKAIVGAIMVKSDVWLVKIV